ncbi:hypothetical protein [Parabacteroides merdae]|uniref:hypothetical protein n=1 Tax=Parabacteroides merdae TaxID=46503 RepID=UPI002F965EBC
MNHTDFYARIRAIKEMEYRELYAAIELHGASYEWNSNDGECPVIAVNTGSVQPAPADVADPAHVSEIQQKNAI